MKRRITGVLGVIVAVGLTSCGYSVPRGDAGGPSEASVLVSNAWHLVELGGQPSLGNVPASLMFPDDGKIAGKASCNSFFGSVRVHGDSLRIEGVGSTKMACPEPIMAQETRYLAALEKARRFEIEGSMLRVYVEGMDQPMKFVRARR